MKALILTILLTSTLSFAGEREGGFGTRGGNKKDYLRFGDSCFCTDSPADIVEVKCMNSDGCRPEDLCAEHGYDYN